MKPEIDKTQKKKRGGRHPMRWIKRIIFLLILAAIVAFVLWVSPLGNGFGWFPSSTPGTTQSETKVADSQEGTHATERTIITVKGENIELNGHIISLDQLRTDLMEMKNPDISVLDEQAIKATYESVIDLLDELKVTYTED